MMLLGCHINMFFSEFPTINYDTNGNGTTSEIQDILIRVIIRDGIRERHSLFEEYDIKDWETPESVSYNYYKSPQYHWVIMMTNKMFDRHYDWPLTERNLQAYVLDKYDNPNATHHYEAAQTSGDTNTKIWVDSTFTGATAVNNLEHERALNDDKKQIKLLAQWYLAQFLGEHSKLIYKLTP